MSAPVIWVVLPVGFTILFWFLQRWPRLTAGLAALFSGLLALFALSVPIGSVTRLGPWVLEIDPALVVIGRRFILENSDRAYLALLYGMGAFWFIGVMAVRASRVFASLGLGIIALMIAAIAVQPFLYAAVLIEAAVLLSVPILVRPGQGSNPGILRFLIFQTLALPFILFAGWAAANVEASPAESKLLLQAVIFLGLGFAFWLAVFPLHTWVPMFLHSAPVYEAGFIMTLLQMAVVFLLLSFVDNFTWLRTYPMLVDALRLSGLLMVAAGGIWAAFQTNAARLFGYAVIIESGYFLLALSLQGQLGLGLFAASLLPRILGLALWALALAVFAGEGISPEFSELQGRFRAFPFASTALIIAIFSIGSLPMLAAFPVRIALWEGLAQQSLSQVIWVLVGNAGFLLAGVRLLGMLLLGKNQNWGVGEKSFQVLLLIGGGVGLLLIGLFPRWFLSGLLAVVQTFQKF